MKYTEIRKEAVGSWGVGAAAAAAVVVVAAAAAAAAGESSSKGGIPIRKNLWLGGKKNLEKQQKKKFKDRGAEGTDPFLLQHLLLLLLPTAAAAAAAVCIHLGAGGRVCRHRANISRGPVF